MQSNTAHTDKVSFLNFFKIILNSTTFVTINKHLLVLGWRNNACKQPDFARNEVPTSSVSSNHLANKCMNYLKKELLLMEIISEH